MQILPMDFAAGTPIDGYGPGFVRVGGQVHHGALLIGADMVRPWGGIDDLAPLAALSGQADLLLIGLGAQMGHAPDALLDTCEAAGMRVEAMTTPAAARSYNVMLAEGRRVAVALLPT